MPRDRELAGTGYRIRLTAGTYPESSLPNYMEAHHGTYRFPIIIESADGPGAAVLAGDLNVFDAHYLYLIGLAIVPEPAGDAFHCERCDHVLVRRSRLSGGRRQAQETLKVNQSSYLDIEDSDISGAHDNAIDLVAVAHGHLIGNRVHDAEDWCAYAKGGSASLRVEANEFFNCGTGSNIAPDGSMQSAPLPRSVPGGQVGV